MKIFLHVSIKFVLSVLLESVYTRAFVATRVDRGGCDSQSATGVFFWLHGEGKWEVTSDLGESPTLSLNSFMLSFPLPAGENSLASGSIAVQTQEWYTLDVDSQVDRSLTVEPNWSDPPSPHLSQGSRSVVSIIGKVSSSVTTPAQGGYVAIGTGGFYPVQFDDFNIIGGELTIVQHVCPSCMLISTTILCTLTYSSIICLTELTEHGLECSYILNLLFFELLSVRITSRTRP